MKDFISKSRVCSTIVAFFVLHSFSSSAAQSPDSDPNRQLIGSLESAVEAMESLSAFDVAGVTIHTKDFGEDKPPVNETNRFRMQVDTDREVLRYVVELRYNTPRAAGNVNAGMPVTSSILIQGKTVERSNAVNGIEQHASVVEFSSFQEALAKGGAPTPGFWGIRDLPLYPDEIKSLQTRIDNISEGNAKVTSTPGSDTIRYTVRIDQEAAGGRYNNVHWTFKLPTHRPILVKEERGSKEKAPETIRQHDVDYAVVQGHEAPTAIRSWNLSAKRGADGIVLGKKRRVTKLKWLRIADGAVAEAREHLTTPEQIESFLDEAPPTVPIDIDAK